MSISDFAWNLDGKNGLGGHWCTWQSLSLQRGMLAGVYSFIFYFTFLEREVYTAFEPSLMIFLFFC
jgi:hypothetical protein